MDDSVLLEGPMIEGADEVSEEVKFKKWCRSSVPDSVSYPKDKLGNF